MAHKQWEEASDYRDIRKKPYYSFKQLSQLEALNIRQLKQLACQINKHLGITITLQLSALLGQNGGKGRAVSNLRKSELIECIWYVRQVQMSRPAMKGEWKFDRISDRIYNFVAPTAECWVHYIALSTEQEAFKLYSHLMNRLRCTLASYRTGDRTHGVWELKVWKLDADTLITLLAKDKPAPTHTPEVLKEPVQPVVEQPVQPVVSERETLEQKCQRYNNIIANGGSVGLDFVMKQLDINPAAKGLVMARGKVVVEDEF